MATPPKKILIYRLGSLGDTVIALPAFHKIREAFPDADITLLTNNPVIAKAAPLESILGHGYFFDRVLAYPVGTRNARVLFKLIKQIRALKIDTLVYLAGVRTLDTLFKTRLTVFRDWCFFKAAGIKHTVGFPRTRPDFVLSTDETTGDLEWEAKRLTRRVQSLGAVPLSDDAYWDLRFTEQELATAQEKLNLLAPGQPIIAASTGTKNQVNDWEEANWLSMLSQLAVLLPGWQLAMLGGPDEAPRANICLEAWGGGGINLCGQTSPRVSGAIMKQAEVFIGHDSGPMHMAAAVGTPCAAVFSARHHPRQWYPRGNNNRIIYHSTDCAGCCLDVCITQHKKCILSITPHEVTRAVIDILEAKRYNKINISIK